MIDVLQSLREGALEASPFPPTSRYHGIGTATVDTGDGRLVAYVRRRFLPPGDRFTVVREHTVREGDRLDNVAATYLGDPEQSWRLCDANEAMHPRELVDEPGDVIAIALPEGYGGPGVAEGVHLTLLAGPVIPAPLPRELLDALTEVEVTNGIESPGGFRLTFSLSSRSVLHQAFLVAATRTPLMRVVVVVTINSTPKVLMNGVLTNQEVSAGDRPGQSTLTVTGEDLTKLMDLQDWSGLPYPGMGITTQVNAILLKYLAFGVVPKVVPPLNLNINNPLNRWETHQGTDLCHIQRLAGEVGYVFYVEPGLIPGTTTAYFGPEIKIGFPQPALNLDLDAHRNVESMSFSFDSASTDLPIVLIQNPLTKAPIPIPIPRINPLQPPLGLFGPPVTKISILKDTAKDSLPKALGKGLARAACSQNAVSATGSLDVGRYGRLLNARSLVGVRGAGLAFDGLHFVDSVTTTMQAGQLKQSFRLSRNGLVSITPVVAA